MLKKLVFTSSITNLITIVKLRIKTNKILFKSLIPQLLILSLYNSICQYHNSLKNVYLKAGKMNKKTCKYKSHINQIENAFLSFLIEHFPKLKF